MTGVHASLLVLIVGWILATIANLPVIWLIAHLLLNVH